MSKENSRLKYACGDTVYTVKNNRVRENVIEKMQTFSVGQLQLITFTFNNGLVLTIKNDDIESKLFNSKEDAEEALIDIDKISGAKFRVSA